MHAYDDPWHYSHRTLQTCRFSYSILSISSHPSHLISFWSESFRVMMVCHNDLPGSTRYCSRFVHFLLVFNAMRSVSRFCPIAYSRVRAYRPRDGCKIEMPYCELLTRSDVPLFISTVMLLPVLGVPVYNDLRSYPRFLLVLRPSSLSPSISHVVGS